MITIEKVSNGYIITQPSDDPELLDHVEVVEVQDTPYGEAEAAVGMLWIVNEQIGHIGSRYDAKRVTISLEPGDRYEL